MVELLLDAGVDVNALFDPGEHGQVLFGGARGVALTAPSTSAPATAGAVAPNAALTFIGLLSWITFRGLLSEDNFYWSTFIGVLS